MLCLPKSLSDKLKVALRSGDVSIPKLYEMTSEERNSLFTSYVGKEMGSFVNGEFEKAMISEQKNALAKWVEKTFDPKQKALKDTTLDKIKKMDTLLNPKEGDDFLHDLVAHKLKMVLTPEEGKAIFERAKNLQDLAPKLGEDGKLSNVDKFGNPTLDYWKARRDMESYVQSINPSDPIEVFANNIGRNMLLASLHTPMKAGISQFINTIFESALRRVSGKQYTSAIDLSLQKDYVTTALDIYNKTGYDVSTMMSLKDDNLFGEKAIHAEGKGPLNATARVVTDIVINKLHGVPFTITTAVNFADSAALEATRIATKEGLTGEALKTRSLEIFKDATSYAPQTEDGMTIRSKAQADAQQATFVNKSFGSNVSSAIKGQLNKLAPGLGTWTIPIAKIPGNVIARGIDVAGGGLVKSIFELKNAYQEFGRTGDKTVFIKPIRTLVPMGLGLTAAYALTSQIDKDNFIGAYPTNANEVALMKLKGGIANSIKIGDHWISLEYLGPIAPAVVGMMYAKKYGDGSFKSYAEQYLAGAGEGIENLPGLSLVKGALDYLATKGQGGKNAIIDSSKIENPLLTFAKSRIIPAFVLDAFKVFGAPDKTSTIFGTPNKEQPKAWQQFLFGSAVSKSHQGPIINELSRLEDEGTLPSLTDVEKRPDVTVFKAEVTPTIYDATINDFKTEFRSNVAQLMNGEYVKPATATKMATTLDYENATDAEKAKMIDTVKANTLKQALEANGYSKAGATGKASFEGQTSYYGNPSIESLSKNNNDDGEVKGKNPNGEPIYKRFSLAQSSKIKSELYNKDSYWKGNGYSESDTQLDHIVPIEAGGTMTKDNLMLISNVSDKLNQQFEDYLGAKYKQGTITRTEAIKASIDYKINKSVSLDDIKSGKY